MAASSVFNLKAIFLLAVGAVLWGGYNVGKASWTALTWEKAEGTIVDFEHNTWSCGKGVSQCYSLIAGYHVGKDYYTAVSDRRYNNNMPRHPGGKQVVIYYSARNPSEAIFGGEYGPNGGIFALLIGGAILGWFWWSKKSVF